MPPKLYREERPWGEFVRFTENAPSTVKILTIKAGEAFSLQTHKERDEFWYVISGNGKVEIGDKVFEAKADESYFVKRGDAHRVTGGTEDIKILEIMFGNYSENDIQRIEDKYGRKIN